MKKIFVVLIIVIFFVGCQRKEDVLIKNIIKTIDNNCDNDICIFNMKDITDYKWDKMVVYKANTANADISNALGVSFRDSTDLICGMVFVLDNKIVYQDKTPSTGEPIDDLSYNITHGQNLIVLTPNNAVFEGIRVEVAGKYYYEITPHENASSKNQ